MIPRRRANDQMAHRVNTGFKSVRDLLVFSLGAWSFWVNTTRVAHPDPWVLGFSVLMMAAPSLAALYRTVNGVYGSRERDPEDMP